MSSIPGQVKKQIGCVPLSMQHLEVRRQTGWLRVRIICQSGAKSPVCSSITKQTLSSSHQVTCSQHDIDEKK